MGKNIRIDIRGYKPRYKIVMKNGKLYKVEL